MSDKQFEENLAFGKIAEGAIARYFIERGYAVIPIPEVERPA